MRGSIFYFPLLQYFSRLLSSVGWLFFNCFSSRFFLNCLSSIVSAAGSSSALGSRFFLNCLLRSFRFFFNCCRFFFNCFSRRFSSCTAAGCSVATNSSVTSSVVDVSLEASSLAFHQLTLLHLLSQWFLPLVDSASSASFSSGSGIFALSLKFAFD